MRLIDLQIGDTFLFRRGPLLAYVVIDKSRSRNKLDWVFTIESVRPCGSRLRGMLDCEYDAEWLTNKVLDCNPQAIRELAGQSPFLATELPQSDLIFCIALKSGVERYK